VRGRVGGAHERGGEAPATHPLARREAVEAGDVRLAVDILLDAGAPFPERISDNGSRATMLITELGIDAPT
jgi:hypothetical protein